MTLAQSMIVLNGKIPGAISEFNIHSPVERIFSASDISCCLSLAQWWEIKATVDTYIEFGEVDAASDEDWDV